MFGHDLAEGCLSHLNNSNMYYSTNEGKIALEELQKLSKHHANHPREMHQRNEHMDDQIGNNNSTFKVGQPIKIRNYAHCTFEPKYLLDY